MSYSGELFMLILMLVIPSTGLWVSSSGSFAQGFFAAYLAMALLDWPKYLIRRICTPATRGRAGSIAGPQ
jgi:ABC-type dipeptide/oligopeptide/nickel transport system permease subunit